MTLGSRSRHPARAGFTLVELLVVLSIIAVVLAILVPALAGARRSARRAATANLMQSLATASSDFMLDERGRTPGYFSAAEMGSDDNGLRGLSGMQNLLLDLSGGVTTATTATPGMSLLVGLGPTTSRVVNVDLAAIGQPRQAGSGTTVKAYFNPDRAYLAAQTATGQTAGGTTAEHRALPALVDAFGQPILAWTEDDRATPGVAFAAISSSTARARFYWNSNRAYLGAAALGKAGRNQLHTGGAQPAPYSMLGETTGGSGMADRLLGTGAAAGSMAALLGNPAYPEPTVAGEAVRPAAARGKLVFQSAGADGWYMGSEDLGGRIARAPTNGVAAYTTNLDAMKDFDDIVNRAGN